MKVLTSFLGVDKTIAQTQIVSEGFTVGVVTEINSTNPSDELNHNKVILQSPISGSLVDYESPISINWRSFTFTPGPYSFTPFSFTPYSFTPYSFTPYSFTPYSFTPYSFTPPPAEKYFSYAYCQNNSLNGYSGMPISNWGVSTVAEACAAVEAALAPYGISQFTCVEGTASSPLYTNMGVVCSAPSTKNYYQFTYYDGKCNYAVYDYLDNYLGSYSTNLCTNSGTDASGATLPSCSNAGCSDGPPYSFTPFAFTPYSFTPYSFTPAPTPTPTPTPYSFTPYSFTPESTGCRQAKPYPYCFCDDSTWLC
jgi:hypothetical protein